MADSNPDACLRLKIGRSNNPPRRWQEWARQCSYAEYVPLGFWPEGLKGQQGSLLKGTVRLGKPSPWACLLERLILLELSDVALNAPYLCAEERGAALPLLPMCECESMSVWYVCF